MIEVLKVREIDESIKFSTAKVVRSHLKPLSQGAWGADPPLRFPLPSERARVRAFGVLAEKFCQSIRRIGL